MEQQQVNFGNWKVEEQELRIRFGDLSPKCEKKAQVTFRPPTKQSCLAAVEDRMMVILLGLSAYVYKFS